jgi:HK97 family phage portal protein
MFFKKYTTDYIYSALSIIYSAVALISDQISLCEAYVTDLTGKRVDHKLNSLLFKPNKYQYINSFLATLAHNLTLHGVAYIINEKSSLIVIDSATAVTNVDAKNLTYVDNEGIKKTVSLDRLVTVYSRGNTANPVSPLMAAAHARETASAMVSYRSSSAKFGFKNGGTVTVEGEYTDEMYTALRKQLAIMQAEFAEANMSLLTKDFVLEPNKLSATDMQLMQQYRFSNEELSRYFGNVPLPLLGDYSALPGSASLDSLLLHWQKSCLEPMIVNIEYSMLNLLTPDERLKYRINVDSSRLYISISDIKELSNNGILTVNEARTRLGLSPVADGNQLVRQAQYLPISKNPE